MSVAVVGAGILGLTLAWRLAAEGESVTLFEAAPVAGGLACGQDFGDFVWDRYYHCILPHDRHTLGLVRELGLGDDLRWARTGTGYWADGRMHDMSGMADYLRFPRLSVVDKARLGALVAYATRADPFALYDVTAEDWLTARCGRRAYEAFWQPLLRAKFGTYHSRVAAVFIWATLTRLAGARSGGAHRESLGYCRGGYARIVDVMVSSLRERGAVVRLGAPVTSARAEGGGCRLAWGGDAPGEARFDTVLFTGPTRVARGVAPDFVDDIARYEARNPTAGEYLGVVCVALALRRPLTSYYVLNIADPTVELTGLIEMTTLVNRHEETAGHALVYLPRYMASDDPRFEEPDAAALEAVVERGLKRLFPTFRDEDIARSVVSRARYVQPLPLAGMRPERDRELPAWDAPFQVVNTALLQCATLNNNEVVALADALVLRNLPRLRGARGRATAP